MDQQRHREQSALRSSRVLGLDNVFSADLGRNHRCRGSHPLVVNEVLAHHRHIGPIGREEKPVIAGKRCGKFGFVAILISDLVVS